MSRHEQPWGKIASPCPSCKNDNCKNCVDVPRAQYSKQRLCPCQKAACSGEKAIPTRPLVPSFSDAEVAREEIKRADLNKPGKQAAMAVAKPHGQEVVAVSGYCAKEFCGFKAGECGKCLRHCDCTPVQQTVDEILADMEKHKALPAGTGPVPPPFAKRFV